MKRPGDFTDEEVEQLCEALRKSVTLPPDFWRAPKRKPHNDKLLVLAFLLLVARLVISMWPIF